MEQSGRVLLAVLGLSIAVSVIGGPQPSSASPQYSSVGVHGNSSLQGSNRNFGILHFETLEVTWRRSASKMKGGGGTPVKGPVKDKNHRYKDGVDFGGDGGDVGGMSTTYSIVVGVSLMTFVILLTSLACWCASKKRKNPNWKLTDCFKRNKLPLEKTITLVQSDVDPVADGEHKVAIDVPRQDHTVKLRKQVSLIHDFKDSSSST